jgi:glycosyltransferase involved in cell wall biosynthesis
MSHVLITEAQLKAFVTKPQFDETIILQRNPDWPRITIVTPSFNQGRYLEQTILSVLNQNYPNLEFIVMDGGSTDNSVQILQNYQEYLTYWQSSRDEGQASAIVAGFRMGSGEILAYLNSDDLYLPYTLKKVGAFLKANPTVQVMYGDCLIIDSNNRVVRRVYPPEFDARIFLYENQIIPQPASFWRHQLYLKVGGITPELQFCMDYDLLMKFVLAGETPVSLSDVLSAFRKHGDTKSSRLQSVQREEYRRIFKGVTRRSFDRRDIFNILYCRLKRYYLRPQGLLEGLRARLSRSRMSKEQSLE